MDNVDLENASDAGMYRAQLRIETETELLLTYLAERLALAAGPAWGWLDGYGGWVRDLIEEAFRKQGLPSQPEYPSTRTKARIPQWMRRAVMERDLYRCQHCDTHLDLTIDHVVPESRGGPTKPDNLQTLCRPCNSRKGTKMPDGQTY